MRTENNEPAVLASVRAHGGYNYRYINLVILAHALVHCRWDEMSGIFECAVWQP